MEEIKKLVQSTKQRSRLYPRYHLQHALEFAESIADLGEENVPAPTVAAKWGKSTTNSTFTGRSSSAKQFGLVSQENSNKFSVTSLAKRILRPISEDDKNSALISALYNAPLYKELVDSFNGKVLPKKEDFANLLNHKFGIQKEARQAAASSFIFSVEALHLLHNGVLSVPISDSVTESHSEDGESLNFQVQNKDANHANSDRERAGSKLMLFSKDENFEIYIPFKWHDSSLENDELNEDLRSIVKKLKSISGKYFAPDNITE